MAMFWECTTDYILLFFVFAFCGWCMEVVLKFIQYHRFINRGFFIGPYCPIYGAGAVLVTIFVGGISNFESSYGMTFVISFFVCGAMEYFVSYYMEKRYHARWWDYSQKPMNLNGRVWMGNLILFGIGGMMIIKVFDPFIFRLFLRIPWGVQYVMAGVLSVIFLADYITSHFVMKLVKVSVENSEADDTEAVGKEVRLLLSNKSIFYQRFADAYPDVIYKTARITKRLEELKNESERFRAEAEQVRREIGERLQTEKEGIAMSLETTGMVKNTIIEQQEELIALMESEQPDIERIQTIKTEIEKQKEILLQRQRYRKVLNENFKQ